MLIIIAILSVLQLGFASGENRLGEAHVQFTQGGCQWTLGLQIPALSLAFSQSPEKVGSSTGSHDCPEPSVWPEEWERCSDLWFMLGVETSLGSLWTDREMARSPDAGQGQFSRKGKGTVHYSGIAILKNKEMDTEY